MARARAQLPSPDGPAERHRSRLSIASGISLLAKKRSLALDKPFSILEEGAPRRPDQRRQLPAPPMVAPPQSLLLLFFGIAVLSGMSTTIESSTGIAGAANICRSSAVEQH